MTAHFLELYRGGLPPFSCFESSIYWLDQIISAFPDEHEDNEPLFSPTAETCLIAIIAHFEAFCKDAFAAGINICPAAASRLAEKRPQVALPLADILHSDLSLRYSIGFIIAERFDFGNPRSVNVLYLDAFGFSPFSSDECDHIERILEDRNLAVHHGGTYTAAYARKRKLPKDSTHKVYFYGLSYLTKDYYDARNFLTALAKKILSSVYDSIVPLLERDSSWFDALAQEALGHYKADMDTGWGDLSSHILDNKK